MKIIEKRQPDALLADCYETARSIIDMSDLFEETKTTVDPLVAAALSGKHDTVEMLLGLTERTEAPRSAHFFKASANQPNSCNLVDVFMKQLQNNYEGHHVLQSPQLAALVFAQKENGITPRSLQIVTLFRDNPEAVLAYCEKHSLHHIDSMEAAAKDTGEQALETFKTDLELMPTTPSV